MRNVSFISLCKFILHKNYLIFFRTRPEIWIFPFHSNQYLLKGTFKAAVKDIIYGVEFGGRIIWLNEIEEKIFLNSKLEPGNVLKRKR